MTHLDRNPPSFKEVNETGHMRPQVRYQPRTTVKGCSVRYYCCIKDSCGGYFATRRGLINHTEYVHVSDNEYFGRVAR